MRKVITVALLGACVATTQPTPSRNPSTPTAAPATAQHRLGPFELEPGLQAHRVYIGTPHPYVGARIEIQSHLTGSDTLERALPACIEAPAGAYELTVSAPATAHLAVYVAEEFVGGNFDADQCEAVRNEWRGASR